MPSLLDKQRYAKELKAIFQTLQAKKATGDGKRRQAKMTQLLELGETRVQEAEKLAQAAAKRASRQNTKRRGGTTTEPVPPKKKGLGEGPQPLWMSRCRLLGMRWKSVLVYKLLQTKYAWDTTVYKRFLHCLALTAGNADHS